MTKKELIDVVNRLDAEWASCMEKADKYIGAGAYDLSRGMCSRASGIDFAESLLRSYL